MPYAWDEGLAALVLQPLSLFHSFTRQPNSPSPVNPKLGIILLAICCASPAGTGSATGAALPPPVPVVGFCSGVLVGSGSPLGRRASPLPLYWRVSREARSNASRRRCSSRTFGSTSGSASASGWVGFTVAASSPPEPPVSANAAAAPPPMTTAAPAATAAIRMPLRLPEPPLGAGRRAGPSPDAISSRGPPAGPSRPPGPSGRAGRPRVSPADSEDAEGRVRSAPATFTSSLRATAGWGAVTAGARRSDTGSPATGASKAGRRGAGGWGAGTNASCTPPGLGAAPWAGSCAAGAESAACHGSWGAKLCRSSRLGDPGRSPYKAVLP